MRDRRGFSLLELVIVLAIAGVIAAVAVNSFGNAQTRMGPRSAEGQFLTMLSQTRALAVERGTRATLVVDAGSAVVSIRARPSPGENEEVVSQRNFADSYGVTIQLSEGTGFEMCMTPRGYADPSCNTFEGELGIRFVRGGQGVGLTLLPLGQAVQE